MNFLLNFMGLNIVGQENKISILSSEFWKREWKNAVQNSTVSRRNYDDIKWIRFWDLMSEYYEVPDELPISIIETFIKEGIINKKSKVLDIGCGVGTFTIPLSKKTKHVVALDPSKKMLEKLFQKIKQLKIKNITLVNSKFEDFEEIKKFDFVLAAFCPVINNVELLLKMKYLSKKYACLITYAKLDMFNLKIRNRLWKELTGKPFISRSFHIIYPFNFLYSLGFRPQLKRLIYNYITERDFESMLLQFETYFNIFIEINIEHRKVIEKFLKNFVKDCKFIFKNKYEIYLMWW